MQYNKLSYSSDALIKIPLTLHVSSHYTDRLSPKDEVHKVALDPISILANSDHPTETFFAKNE